MALSNSIVELSEYWYDKLIDNKSNLGLADVFYGDQEKIPSTPVVCVEPGYKTNLLDLGAMARKLNIEFNLSFLIYHSFITSPQENRRGADLLAEAVESMVHSDKQAGTQPNNLVIHGYCTSVESGYTTKGNSLLRSCKVMYYAKSQVILPS